MQNASMTFVATGPDPLRVGLWRDLHARNQKIFSLAPGEDDDDAISRKQITKDNVESIAGRLLRAPEGTAFTPYDPNLTNGRFLIGDPIFGIRAAQIPDFDLDVGGVVDDRVNFLAVDVPYVDKYGLASDDLNVIAAINDYNAGVTGGFKFKNRTYVKRLDWPNVTGSGGYIYGNGKKSRIRIPADVTWASWVGNFFRLGSASTLCSETSVFNLKFQNQHSLRDGGNVLHPDVFAIDFVSTMECQWTDCSLDNVAGICRFGNDVDGSTRSKRTYVSNIVGTCNVGVQSASNILIAAGAVIRIKDVHVNGADAVATRRLNGATIRIRPPVPGVNIDTVWIQDCALQLWSGFADQQGKHFGVHLDRNQAQINNVRIIDNNFDRTGVAGFWFDNSTTQTETPGDQEDAPEPFSRMFHLRGNRFSTETGEGIVFDLSNSALFSGAFVVNNRVSIKTNNAAFRLNAPGKKTRMKVFDNSFAEVGGATKDFGAILTGNYWEFDRNTFLRDTTQASDNDNWVTAIKLDDASATVFDLGQNPCAPNTAYLVEPVYSAFSLDRRIYRGSSPTMGDLGVVQGPRDGSTNQNTAIAGAVTAWQAVSSTASETSNAPNPLARPLNFLAGDYRHSTGVLIETCGVDNVVQSDGADARQRGISYLMKHSRSEFKNLNVSGAPVGTADKIGFKITGDLRRNGYMLRCVAADRDVGHWYEGTGAFDTIVVPMAFRGRKGFHISGNNFDIINPTAVGITGPWGMEFSSAQGVRSINAHNGGNTFLRGSSANVLIENYFTQASLTGGKKRVCGTIIGSPVNVGGYPELTIVAKISATVAASGPIFQGGDEDNRAEARVVFTGTAGSVSSILAGATELLAAPVSYTTSASATATAIAAAINANGATAYNAIARSNAVIIWAPTGANFGANGRSIAATTSGGLTASFNSFVRFNWASAHGFSDIEPVPQFFRFDTAPHAGDHVVAAVINTTDVIVEVSDTTTGTVGMAWVPHLLIPEEGGATLANTGGAYDRAVGLRSPITDTTITLNIPFADLPALPALSRVEAPGWDVWVHALDTNTLRANDQFFHGGNINYLLILGAFNCFWNRTRIKRRVHVLDRANVQMRSEAMQFYRQGRGRASADSDQVPAVSGASTGWYSEEYNPGADQGLGYYTHATPNKNLSPIDGKPQLNERRQYEDRFEDLIGGVLKLTIDTNAVRMAAPMRLASYTIANKPSAVTAGAGALIWVTDAAPANDKRAYSDGTVWRDSAGTTI